MISRKSQFSNGRQQFFAEIRDPEIHGVAAGQAQVLHLRADGRLQARLDIAQQQIGLRLVAVGKFGIEIREDVQVGGQRLAIVHVGRILAGPEKSFAGNALQTFQIDPAAGEQIGIFLGEIVADHGDNADLREIACG